MGRDIDTERSSNDTHDEPQLRLVTPPGWRPPPEAGRVLLRLVLSACERRAAA